MCHEQFIGALSKTVTEVTVSFVLVHVCVLTASAAHTGRSFVKIRIWHL